MQIKQHSDGTIKIHFFDHDRYEVTDDNGVDVWLNKVDVDRLKEMLTGNVNEQAIRKDATKKVLDYLDEWVNGGENLTLFKWELREVLRKLRSKGRQE